ncbi:MAG: hypothetical protein QM668_08550 [Agriterribacter sp.]
MTNIKLILLFFTLTKIAYAQKNNYYYSNNRGNQSGVSLKLQFETGFRKNTTTWRAGLSGGVGSFLGSNWLFPSLNVDLMLYGGGIGSNRPRGKRFTDVELAVAYTFTAGVPNRMFFNSRLNPERVNYPLYYLNTFNLPPLQNPFNYSASWGGNLIFFLTGKKTWFQQVGFANIHADRVQFSYTNDGPPFFLPFGDKYDRLHTGGGFITLHGNNNWPVNLFEVGFNKFTGYTKNTYELSNLAGLIYLYYADVEQQYFNRSHFYFNAGNTRDRWGVSLNFYNYPKLDIQHLIHQNLFYPLHIVPHAKYVSIGGSFFYNSTKIGLK